MSSVEDLIGRSQVVGDGLASLTALDRERFENGLDNVIATCRSGRDALAVLALVYSAEAHREGRTPLAELWRLVAIEAGRRR